MEGKMLFGAGKTVCTGKSALLFINFKYILWEDYIHG